jgi:hypothetical protein
MPLKIPTTSRTLPLLSGSAARSAASIHSFARARHSSPEAIHTPNAKHIGCVPLNERKASVPRTKKPWIQFMTKGRRKIGDEPSCRVDLARVARGENSRHRFWNMKSCVLRHRTTVWILDFGWSHGGPTSRIDAGRRKRAYRVRLRRGWRALAHSVRGLSNARIAEFIPYQLVRPSF